MSSRHYFVGSGIASLAGAAFLIRDGGVVGHDIHVLEEGPQFGGALDAQGNAATGYYMSGSRMFEADDLCTQDLMDSIPSLSRPQISVHEESACAAVAIAWHRHARMLDRRGLPVDAVDAPMGPRDDADLQALLQQTEAALDGRRIQDCFQPSFFDTAFWLEWGTTFGLKRRHSAIEFRRCLRRFGAAQDAGPLGSVYRTVYNQYECLAVPLKRWLRDRGVEFRFRCSVVDMALRDHGGLAQVSALQCLCDGVPERINLGPSDRALVTLGSMTAGRSFGSMIEPAPLHRDGRSAAWRLWETLAAKHPGFGRPRVFSDDIDGSCWISFTVTAHDPRLFELMKARVGHERRSGMLVRLKDSPWLLTLALYHQPFFQEQPEHVLVWWGYGHFPDRPGEFVRKPMCECSGAEILEEVLCQLHLPATDREHILATSNCIPCAMPYATSPLQPRRAGDRPQLLPTGLVNLACLGQFVEMPDEIVSTVEYSVRSAQWAVYRLLGLERPLPPVALVAGGRASAGPEPAASPQRRQA